MKKILEKEVFDVLNVFLKKSVKTDKLNSKSVKNNFISIKKYSSDFVENESFYKPISRMI